MSYIISSEYQRRERERLDLENKVKAIELLDFNFQVRVINSTIKYILNNFPKSLPSRYSNIQVLPTKVGRTAWILYAFRKGSGKYAKDIVIYLTEKGELVIEVPVAIINKQGKADTARRCHFLELNTVQNSFDELSSGIYYLEDEKFFKEIARELADLFCSDRRFRGMFNIAPKMNCDQYHHSKPSVLAAKNEYRKERNKK